MAGPTGRVLVLGGGIGGMQAALDLAEAGFYVYLAEHGPAIGGTMARLDKTFPTNDCAMCIMSPKLVEAGRHLNIEVITDADLISLAGEAGRYTAYLSRRPRYVRMDKCTGCGDCAEACPVVQPSAFDAGLGKRKAIYKLYPQATPNAFGIEKRGMPPCRATCPAGCNGQAYAALIAQGKFQEALDVVRRRVPFASICGRICHHPCETECNRGQYEGPVALAALKRAAADFGWPGTGRADPEASGPQEGLQPVAVIGAGPGGLTAAMDLAALGHPVTVFDASGQPGGMLRQAVPRYRLPLDMLDRELDWMLSKERLSFRGGVKVGRDVSLAALRAEGFAAFVAATGFPVARGLPLPGADLGRVYLGLDFLRQVNAGDPPAVEGPVVVIGGGNVAVDCARTARRLGAQAVTVACLESRDMMPAHSWEIDEALEEGVAIAAGWGPKAITAGGGNAPAAVECIGCVSVFDAAGRFSPVYDETKRQSLPVATVILAIGQGGDNAFLAEEGVQVTRAGGVVADPRTGATAAPGIFACGDAVSGPASAVEAIAGGHRVAETVHRYLLGLDLEAEAAGEPERARPPAGPVPARRRHPVPLSPAAKHARDFSEVSLGYDRETAQAEAARCLQCGVCSECLECVHACQREAVNHADCAQDLALEVGAVILAPGAESVPVARGEYGYGYYPNVLTSQEFERVLSASGPFAGNVERPSDGKEPRKIAFLQCVGSRDVGCGQPYCSAVCCMYATKEAIIAQEHIPGLQTAIFFMDMRAYGKEFDRYYEAASAEHGVRYHRCMVSGVRQDPLTKDLDLTYVDDGGRHTEETFDMVVLSTGLRPAAPARLTAGRLGLDIDPHGFLSGGGLEPWRTQRPGIYAAGTVTDPKDIPETVVEASAAACAASRLLASARGTQVKTKEYPPERDVSAEDPRVGVFICRCGRNIANVVDVAGLVANARGLPGVAYVEENLYTCSQDTQGRIREKIEEHSLNRVVVASCTPRTHEPLFRDTLREAGLNPYLFEMANIRDQCSWVHMHEPERATVKARSLVAMAVAKARLLYPIPSRSFPINQSGLVIGGGLAGMTAALALAEQGYAAHLVEREPDLGGHLRHIHTALSDREDPQALLQELRERVRSHPLISLHLSYQVRAQEGYLGNYRTTLAPTGPGEERVVEHGAVIVATGAAEASAPGFGQGADPRIITQTQLEEDLGGPGEARAGVYVLIQCAGSRSEQRPYCSRICCTQAVKNAVALLKRAPGARVFILYRDLRTYGLKEGLYEEARRLGVTFVRYDAAEPPEVKAGKVLTVEVEDTALGARLVLEADHVVLATGIEPKDNNTLAKILKVPLTVDGFFLEAHLKLRPVEFAAEGIYLCGLAHSPRFIAETIAQANAAAIRAVTLLSQPQLAAKGITVSVNERTCTGCGICLEACAYAARELDEETGVAKIREILCQGCGACAVACPSGATQQKGFEQGQVLAMVEAALD
ncbi:MAG: FAD-dependent oxidoreductase [Bacillota bacterium]